MSRALRRLRERAKPKPLSRSELREIAVDQLRRVKASYVPLEVFLNDLTKGEMEYEHVDGVDTPVVFFKEGGMSRATDAFELSFEFVYQVLRFTESTKLDTYYQDMYYFRSLIHEFVTENAVIAIEDVISMQEFLAYSKAVMLSTPFNIAERVIDEITTITTPKIKAGVGYTVTDLREWLIKLGKRDGSLVSSREDQTTTT